MGVPPVVPGVAEHAVGSSVTSAPAAQAGLLDRRMYEIRLDGGISGAGHLHSSTPPKFEAVERFGGERGDLSQFPAAIVRHLGGLGKAGVVRSPRLRRPARDPKACPLDQQCWLADREAGSVKALPPRILRGQHQHSIRLEFPRRCGGVPFLGEHRLPARRAVERHQPHPVGVELDVAPHPKDELGTVGGVAGPVVMPGVVRGEASHLPRGGHCVSPSAARNGGLGGVGGEAISAPSGEMSKSAIGSLVDGKTNHLSESGTRSTASPPAKGTLKRWGTFPSVSQVPKPVGAIPGDVRFDRLLLERFAWSRAASSVIASR